MATMLHALKEFSQNLVDQIKPVVQPYIDRAQKKAQHQIRRFNTVLHVMEEGHYRSDYKSPLGIIVGKILGKKKEKELNAPGMIVGSKMIGGAMKYAEKYMWVALAAFLTVNGYIYGTIALGIAGFSFVTHEYKKARMSRTERITETNFAGQIVRGRRCDLYHLHKAQYDMLHLSDHFKRASMESSSDTLRTIHDRVKNLTNNIEVLDPGPYGGSATEYSFREKEYRIVDSLSLNPIASNDNMLTTVDLASAWSKVSKKELVQRLEALQEILPPEVVREVNARALRQAKADNTAGQTKFTPRN